MATARFESDVLVTGSFYAQGGVFLTDGSVTTAKFSSSPTDRLAASKAVHQHAKSQELFGPAVSIAALTQVFYVVVGDAATLNHFSIVTAGVATGDRAATVDLKKSTGGGSYASILTAPIAINSSTAIRSSVAATIATASLVAGDILEVVVAITGSTGTVPTGLTATCRLSENPV